MTHEQEMNNEYGTFSDKSPDMEDDDTMFDLDICSATDCTGLIPALPATDSEITSYEQLYHFLPRAKD